jgi:hypothetical protein
VFPVLAVFLPATVGLSALAMVVVVLELVVPELDLPGVPPAGVELDLAGVVFLMVAPVVLSPWVAPLSF